MITGAVPAEFSVRGSVDGVFTITLPNARLAGLIVNCEPAAAAAFSCRAKVLETLRALAVNVTACAGVTDDTVAVKPALVAFTGTSSVAGTVTAELLLARLTLRPPLPAAAVSVIVQLSLPGSVTDALMQESALNAACAVVPPPVGLITVVPQPNGGSTIRKHAKTANSPAHRPSGLRIGRRPQARFELNTGGTRVNVSNLQRDQKDNCG